MGKSLAEMRESFHLGKDGALRNCNKMMRLALVVFPHSYTSWLSINNLSSPMSRISIYCSSARIGEIPSCV